MALGASRIDVVVLLVLTTIVHGTPSPFLKHLTAVNVTAGQNVSLPCIESDRNQKVVQLQWHKDDEAQILVLFNPAFPLEPTERVGFEVVNRNDTKALQGSILHLYTVTEKDSGEYVCTVTTFPQGSKRCSTKVYVKAPEVQLKVTSPNRTLVEGDDVDVSCVSDPPAESYSLSCARTNLTLRSQDGSFRIPSIARRCRMLTCRPQWNSSTPSLQKLQADVQLTVDYVDVKCNTGSRIDSEVGSNLTITCQANSSTTDRLTFAWTKGNKSLSQNSSLNLWSVNPDQSGIYTLKVLAENHLSLYQQLDFIISVINTTHTDQPISATPWTTQEVTHLTSTTSSSSSTSTILTTVSTSTIAPSTGDTTTVHVNGTESSDPTSEPTSKVPDSSQGQNATFSPGITSTGFIRTHPNTRTSIFTSTVMSSSINPSLNISQGEGEKDPTTKNSHILFVISLLLLLAVICFLYRRYSIQRKMDLPPPFKPPPPPVKYTSPRSFSS